ncbi:hypothetical protein CEUSTIGMA_g3981.t1 [Chlamydomonas eustigma]|uniref:YdbS-like PH domain-containing protein n=1 Tax=Chlamydomonas eustigma TaxID=1157962 RepID=A0A250X0G5_9CHLO|nr:hypothetical protein CEUSTIGMA_g3981.t1 [Chlamydomonas eustigma]|eukprot:GAX76535.1 hypothetical protein CEUSTIGMA_g3981.t1 [Chlamydomonas eustigma]
MLLSQPVNCRPQSFQDSKRAPFKNLNRPCARGSRNSIPRAAAEDPDAELEKRLERLRTVKGATPYGQSAKASKQEVVPKDTKKDKPTYDWTGETVHYEGTPHRGDLIVNLALGTTLVWLPLTLSAISRAAFVTYKFTDRRLSVSTNAPWKVEQTDIAYQEVKDVVTVGRGVGMWGDMVVTLKDGSKVELRSLDKFTELRDYILKRRDELAPESSLSGILTAGELLRETASTRSNKKGFGM